MPTMPRKTPTLFPAMTTQLDALGERLRLARLRRSYSASTVAARAGITRVTLARIEKGDPGTSMGAYVAILRVLGLQDCLEAVASDDRLGRKLQDLQLPVRQSVPRRKAQASGESAEKS